MLTKKGYFDLIRRISETGGKTEDMANLIDKLKADYDEREGMLRKYGEYYDGEDRDEFDYKENNMAAAIEEIRKERDDWRDRYDRLDRDYKERFWGTRDIAMKVEDIKRETEEDVKRDGEYQTIEELFERIEG